MFSPAFISATAMSATASSLTHRSVSGIASRSVSRLELLLYEKRQEETRLNKYFLLTIHSIQGSGAIKAAPDPNVIRRKIYRDAAKHCGMQLIS